MAKQEKFIQVGVTALRDPATGEFLPAVPLYIKAEDGAEEGGEQRVMDKAQRVLIWELHFIIGFLLAYTLKRL